MGASKLVMDLRIWVALGIIASFTVPTLDLPFSTLIIIDLIIQMTLSMHGLRLSLQDLRENKRGSALSILLCYGINTVATLLIGLMFFREQKEIWYGWVMLASMPCAIAVVTAATLMRERIEIAVLAVTATYLSGIVLTPVLSFTLIGDAVDPLKILEYILLFIILPVILSRLLAHVELSREVKVPVINLTMAIMVFCSVNSNRATLEADPTMVLLVLGAAVLRLVALNLIMWFLIRRTSFAEGSEGTYRVLGVWKNTGLSVSMCMVILEAMPSAVIPCFLSMIVETLWFSFYTRSRGGGTGASEPPAPA